MATTWQSPAAAPPDPTDVIGRRIAAWLVDLVLFFGVVVAVFAVTAEYLEVPAGISADAYCDVVQGSFPDEVATCTSFDFGDEARIYVLSEGDSALQSLATLAYFVGFVVLQGLVGASPGKLVLGLRVVDAMGQAAGVLKSLVRTLLWIVDGVPYLLPLVGLITGITTTGHRRVGDMAAGTYVVSRRAVGFPVLPVTAAPPPGEAAWGMPAPGTAPQPGGFGVPVSGPGWEPPGSPTEAGAPTVPPPDASPAPGTPATSDPAPAGQPPADGGPTAGASSPPTWAPPTGPPTSTPPQPPRSEPPTWTPPTGPASEPPSWTQPTTPAPETPSWTPPAEAPTTPRAEPPTWTPPTGTAEPSPTPDRPATSPLPSWTSPVGETDSTDAAGEHLAVEPQPDGSAAASPPADAGDLGGAGAGSTPAAEAAPASASDATPQFQPLPPPQWDAARNTYIQWDPNRNAWLQWDDARQTWKPIDT